MKYIVKKFIEANIELVDNYNFEEFYNKATKELNVECISDISAMFHSIGVYPYKMLKKIPFGYYAHLPDKILHVGSNVKEIAKHAFGFSSIEKLIIDEGCVSIKFEAFNYCDKLNYIVLPKSLEIIEKRAFSNISPEIVDIHYNGTKADWRAIDKKDAFQYISYIVHCLDGDIKQIKK